ncbi:unnamed protein product [Danaus chrysippus]|uniref:(African queen) hypothetical protein n=1 Tax=Danaus chrysippus TaxID=151541 RepID=A0A8J2R5A5_9NEOP|nr:unnamed protein product [Danaus chrysippus]
MKITLAVILLAAVSNAARSERKSQEKNEEKQEKRGLIEGNSGVDKRAPLLPTVPPSSGVEYANTKQSLPDKSPPQQIYATPQPQISKISDFLTGQGASFPSAIASHLYSPVSVYNPKYENPTTYEVSAPVPSQLAYTEHQQTVPSANSLQFSQKPQKLSNYLQSQAQSAFEQQNLGYEPIIHQVPNNAINNNFQPVQYNQALQGQVEQQQLHYVQGQSIQIIPRNVQQHPILIKKQRPEQRDIKNIPAPAQIFNKQNLQQVYNDKPQKALSFASFTYNPSSQPAQPSYDQTQNQQLYTQSQQSHVQQQQLQPQQLQTQQLQPQQLQQQYQPQQYQSRGQTYEQIPYQLQQQAQLSEIPYQQIPQQIQYQSPQALQYQPQAQVQYQDNQAQLYQQLQQQLLQAQLPQQQQQYYQLQQPQPQYFDKPEQTSQQTFVDQQYIKQAPIQAQFNEQLPQQQPQSLSYKQAVPAQAALPVLPTFPPVQYFGKFAHSVFGNSQH